MKKLLLLTMALLLPTAGAVYANGFEVEKKAGDYNVEVRLDKNPPVVGNNNMVIEIRDTSGMSVTDAKVRVNYSMPAMSGMPAMNYKTDAALTGGKYTAVLNIPMSGSWGVAIKMTIGRKTSTVKFNVDAE
jgi:hypothetical protein